MIYVTFIIKEWNDHVESIDEQGIWLAFESSKLFNNLHEDAKKSLLDGFH